jgi:predicted transcriptional regulator
MPSAKQHTNIRLDAGILAEIDGLAQQQDRSRSYMIEQTILAGLDVLQGKARGELGNTVPEPIAQMSAKRTSRRGSNGN